MQEVWNAPFRHLVAVLQSACAIPDSIYRRDRVRTQHERTGFRHSGAFVLADRRLQIVFSDRMGAMSQFTYGVLTGTVSGHLRDADDDHYQILVNANGTMYRIAVNVRSSLKPPDLLFQARNSLTDKLTEQLKALTPGFKKLANKPGGLAQDFVRGELVKRSKFKVVPGDAPGADNDLKDTLEAAVLAAIEAAGTVVYAFGAKWAPEKKKDQYFKFLPGNGVHNIHMNQGNDKGHSSEDGVYRDGS